MCLVSVAFFASCTKPVENPEPAISVISDEGFIQNGDVIDLGTPFVYGFKMTANTETKKELSQLSITTTIIDLDGKEESSEEIISISGQSEYSFVDTLSFVAKDIIAYAKFTAVVTDVDGKTNSAIISVSINEAAQPLFARPIEWIRKGADLEGNTEVEMKALGLQWTGSYKEVFATIRPLTDATLYLCNGDDYDKITTDVEKAAYFADLTENAESIDKYRNITTNNSANYNDMLAVVYNGETYLIHITRAEIATGNYGTQITIKGETK